MQRLPRVAWTLHADVAMAKRNVNPRADRIRVGVAGWDYPDWKGVVYPHPRPRGFDPLIFLGRYIDMVEVNSTFYRPAKADVAKRWASRAADGGLRLSAKLWRRFTHERGSAWTRDEVRDVTRGLDPLRRSGVLSAVLAQFPWSFKNEPESFEWLRDVRRAFARFPLVIEVRHESWNEPDFFEWLRETDTGFVNVDQPLFSKSIRPSARGTAHIGYIRVHGRNYHDWFRKDAGRDARYDFLYDPEQLAPWVARAKQIEREEDVDEVDVVFNNHYKAQAVVNALQFKKRLTRRVVRAPAQLGEAYGEELAEAGVRVEEESAAA